MSLLTHSRRQRYGKILKLQNNLKGNIWEDTVPKPIFYSLDICHSRQKIINLRHIIKQY